MRQVQDEELSALLDGELDWQRAEEVRALIQADPALRQEFEALGNLHSRLLRVGEQAAFTPDLVPADAVGETPAWEWAAGISVVLSLITVRLLPKLVELSLLGVGLHLAACAAIVVFIIGRAREPQPLTAPALPGGTGA